MEITHGLLYWITRLDTIKEIIGCIELIGLVVFGCALFFGGMLIGDAVMLNDPDRKILLFIGKKVIPWVAGILLFFSVLDVILPTTKEMAAVIVVPKIVNNEKLNMAGHKLVDLAIEWASSEISNKKKSVEDNE